MDDNSNLNIENINFSNDIIPIKIRKGKILAHADNLSTSIDDINCSMCLRINKTPGDEMLSRLKIYDCNIHHPVLLSPLCENWVALPHKCTFSNLCTVEDYYFKNWISDHCYDEWMAINGGSYQLGKGGMLKYLWDERMHKISNMNINDQIKILDDIENMPKNMKTYKCNKHQILHVNLLNNKYTKACLRPEFKWLNKVFPFFSDTDKKHTNIDLTSLVLQVIQEMPNGVEHVNQVFRRCPVGMTNSIVVSLLIHSIGNENYVKIAECMDIDNVCCMDNNSYRDYFKAISIAVRRTAIWFDGTPASLGEITSCASWELPLGRHGMLSDWEEEYNNRVNHYLPLKLPDEEINNEESNMRYIDYAESILDEIIVQLVPTDYTWPSWEKFCKDRNSWLTSGSAGSKHAQVEGIKVRLNKRSFMETVPIDEMVDWINKEPVINAIASEKYEMGKARAIYGTDVVDQGIMSYLLVVLEPRLSNIDDIESGLTGKAEVLSIIRRKEIAGRDGEECTMLDYSDFNRQHTLTIQSLVFKCIKKRLISLHAHADAIRIADWCEQSMLNQKVKFPGKNEFISVCQGLFSGMRGTNFVNTLLNKLYFKVAEKWIKENLDIGGLRLFSLHQGDDVWISNQSRLWAICLYRSLQRCGLIFSDKKQIQDKNMAEFLRVIYTKEGAKGYLARSVATLIERPLSSELEISPTMKAVGINSQIQTCYRRGLSRLACEIIWKATVPFSLKSHLEGRSSITIPTGLVCRSFSEGGLDIGLAGTLPRKSGTIPPIPVMEYQSEALEKAIPKHTTDAYVQLMSEEICEPFNAESIRNVLHAANVSDSIPEKDKVRCLLKFHKQVKIWREKCNKSNIKQVVRDLIDMEEWSENEFDKVLDDELNVLAKSWHVEKLFEFRDNVIELIMFVISQSPYKDIASARRGHNLNVIEAANMCIFTSKARELKARAAFCLRELIRQVGDQVTVRILSGVRGYGPSMESWFNPVPLSYITQYATQRALNICIEKRITKVDQWDKILNDCLRISFKTAYRNKILYEISHY